MSAQKNNNSPKPADKKKQILIGVICVIVLLNVMWTVMQNKFTPKLDEFKKEVNTAIAALDERITKIEKGGFTDVENIRAEFESLKQISTSLSERLTQSLKSEEEQLESLEAQVKAQRERVEAMKKLAK